MRKAETNKIFKLGDVYYNPKNISNGRGTVFDTDGICGTLVTMGGGGNKPMVIVTTDVIEGDDYDKKN